MKTTLPTAARIVIIGGGAIGTSIAYHLAKAGERDVLLLEKTKLTEGATWHAAGLVGQFRSQQNLMALMRESVTLFDGLAADTGQEIGWRKVGSMRVAASEARWLELLKSHSAAKAVGFEMQLLTPSEARALYPLMETGDLTGAAFIPEDGHVDPYSLTQAYAKGLRKYGGQLVEGVMVTGLRRSASRLTHVETAAGAIECEWVVNAAGLWARQVGRMARVELPAGVVQHQYFVTEKTPEIPDGLPAFRDPDGGYYAKPEPGALAVGGWEATTDTVNPREGFPLENARHLFDAHMPRLEEVFVPAAHRLPILNTLGVRTVINGPIPISPDGEPVMGPVPGLGNFFAACAFTSGIAASGGVGRAAANWILEGDPGRDLWAFDVRRFGPLQAGHRFLHDRAVESYSKYYDIAWPGHELSSARGVRRSPLYGRLKAEGAVFGAKFGWERANFFAPGGISPAQLENFERAGQAETVGREHMAARQAAAICDQTSFTKFEISGRRACQYLQFLATANIDKPVGGSAYTQLCNARGGIEADVTIIRRAPDLFWLITGSALGIRDRSWLDHGLALYAQAAGAEFHEGDIQIRDITSAMGVLNLQGPRARQILAGVCDDPLDHDSFPFMTARDIRIGYAPVVAFRVTYVGELGWELYMPMEYMEHVYETLMKTGRPLGLTDMGYYAIDSLRLEKRFLAWGADINSDYTPIEAGLDFLIDWDKGEFLGRGALARQRETGPSRKLVALVLDAPVPVFGGEAIFHGGSAVAQATSGNFGYAVGKPIVLAYLPAAIAGAGTRVEVESFGRMSPATAAAGAPYDPSRKKVLV